MNNLDTVLDRLKLTVDNPRQILNMGGPWIGNILLDGKLIAEDCITDNFVFGPQLETIYFVKYHVLSRYDWHFTINYTNLNERTVCEYSQRFKSIYIKRLVNEHELEIFHAFHDKMPLTRDIFNINKEPNIHLP